MGITPQGLISVGHSAPTYLGTGVEDVGTRIVHKFLDSLTRLICRVMGSHSDVQGRCQLCELRKEGVGGHSGGADKVSEGLHVNYS